MVARGRGSPEREVQVEAEKLLTVGVTGASPRNAKKEHVDGAQAKLSETHVPQEVLSTSMPEHNLELLCRHSSTQTTHMEAALWLSSHTITHSGAAPWLSSHSITHRGCSCCLAQQPLQHTHMGCRVAQQPLQHTHTYQVIPSHTWLQLVFGSVRQRVQELEDNTPHPVNLTIMP